MTQAIAFVEKNVSSPSLFEMLVKQLQKDFEMSSQRPVEFPQDSAHLLVHYLKAELIYVLDRNDVTRLSSLLYRVDVSEESFAEIEHLASDDFVDALVLLVLKREWQKVWIRSTIG